MPGRLDGKVALVAGASSGIGEATALALEAEGVRVAAAARRRDRLEVLVKVTAGCCAMLVLRFGGAYHQSKT